MLAPLAIAKAGLTGRISSTKCAMRLSNLGKRIAEFWWTLPTSAKVLVPILLLFIFCFCALIVAMLVSYWYDDYKARQFSAAEHLQIAERICPQKPTCGDAAEAISHLEKIPPGAPEYAVASEKLSWVRDLQQERERTVRELSRKRQAEHDRLINQSEEQSRAQMLRNVAGQAHDGFTCSTSTNDTPLMSFDFGHYWWADDGRCAGSLEKAREANEQRGRERIEQEEQRQQKRNDDARLNSWWPTTIRVDTDMDSFWLNNEERTCRTYPDKTGRVSIVACTASETHRDHNIPVKFWGGVDRNTVSDWRCQRDGDQFVCRAIN